MNSLLKKSFPKYTIKAPSGKKMSFRPFTVREENSILIAKQTGSEENILETVIDVMSSCFEEDVKTFKINDFLYAFLNIRSKSIGEIENATIKCPFTNEEVQVVVNCVDDIKIENKKVNNTIKLDDCVITLKEITIKDIITNLNYNKSFEEQLQFIAINIVSIEKENELIKGDDLSLNEKIDYISNMSSKEFKKLVNYYDMSSKLYFELQYQTSDKNKRNIELAGPINIISFFLTI